MSGGIGQNSFWLLLNLVAILTPAGSTLSQSRSPLGSGVYYLPLLAKIKTVCDEGCIDLDQDFSRDSMLLEQRWGVRAESGL